MSRKSESLERRRVPSQERAKVRVENILAATRELLLESGIGAVTTARVAERAGVPVGSVYQYFPNKKAILAALYEEYLSGVRAVVDEFAAQLPTSEPWFVFMDRLSVAIERAEFGQDIEGLLAASAHTFPELREHERRHADLILEGMVRILRGLGSRWPKPKLRRLVSYMYMVNSATTAFRREYQPPPREAAAWDSALVRTIVGQCLAD
jgi:AcrR family transcriptional regulator